jgi:hypothetical protein
MEAKLVWLGQGRQQPAFPLIRSRSVVGSVPGAKRQKTAGLENQCSVTRRASTKQFPESFEAAMRMIDASVESSLRLCAVASLR